MKPFHGSVFLVLLLIFSGKTEARASSADASTQTLDVLEGENVLLECKFPQGLFERDREYTHYWIRSNRHGHDNVAIGSLQLENNYALDFKPESGIYHLRISNATYDRDNGQFECRMKEGKTGKILHTKSFDLTVLLKPSPPSISPANPTATEGRPFNLTCSSLGGSPPPQIKWYKLGYSQMLDATILRGENKDEATRSILNVVPTKNDDGASYRCTVWNRALRQEHSLEAGTKVFVNYFPRITLGPENPLRVEKDDTAQLNCNVDAKPAVTSVKWMRNGRFIDTHFVHTIPRVSLQDSGKYACSADNGLGKIGKAEIELDILYAPVVTLPNSREVNENSDVEIDCRVDANPRPSSIQWYKEGDERFIQNGPTLRLKSVTAFHNGRYICSASNILQPSGKGSLTRTGNATIDINIRHAPGQTFIMPDKPQAVDGQPITLKCGATPSGYPTPTYKWWREGSESSTLAIGPEFTLDPARLNNMGTYSCQAANELGVATPASMFLEVFKAPEIITPLQPSIMKKEGDVGFQLTCNALGKPLPRVQWFKDGQEISQSSTLYEVSSTTSHHASGSDHQPVSLHSVLKFSGPERIGSNHLMSIDRGHYTCQFENRVASKDSSMLLRVEHSPVVLHRYNRVAFDLGEPALIKCRMQAFPDPKFDWSFGNSVLQEDPRFYRMNTTSLGEDVYEGMLRIKEVTEASYGDYVCRAMNGLGSKRTIIKLQPKGKPEKPESLKATASSHNTISLRWEPGFDGGFSNTKYIVQYRHGNELAPQYTDCGSLQECNITLLQQNSPYLLKVKAKNDRGESKFTEEIVVMTKVDAKQIPVPHNVHYEKSTQTASFALYQGLGNMNLDLIAMIELENGDGTWSLYDHLPMHQKSFEEININNGLKSNLRVRFCLELNEILCGPYAEALVVDVRPNAATSAFASMKSWVIAVIVLIVLLTLMAVLIILRCCCFKKAKSLKSDDVGRPSIIHNTTSSNPPPYSGIDNKGVDTSLKDSDDSLKAHLYGGSAGGHHHVHYVDQPHSNSNSANGGSVNSQDSLWNVKSNNGAVVANGTNGAVTDIYHLQQSQPQHGPHGYSMYDPQMQAAHFRGGFVGSEDYTHYPYPDEYLNERNRQYVTAAGSEPYVTTASTNKPKQPEYYGDVSGLPDPFHEVVDSSNGGHHPSTQQQKSHPMQHMTFEESLGESGYSTPNSRNRRIIREIIV